MHVKKFYSIALIVFAAISAAPCFAHHMAVVVAKQSSVTTVTSTQLGKIFRTDIKRWPDGKPIALVLHRSSAGEAITLQRLNKMSAQQWQAWTIEHKDSLKLVDSDEEVLTYVENTPGAVGLVDVRSVTDRVTVIRVDGKVPMEDGYLPH
jgi:ABC-type phosphate transport system substrate-binding protein